MITVTELSSLSSIAEMKASYLDKLIVPMDGMWDVGFTNVAPHWEIRVDGDRAGYCAINDEGAILQFFVDRGFESFAEQMFEHVAARDTVKGATVSTNDPLFMSLCLDRCKSIDVHTFMYELQADRSVDSARRDDNGKTLRLADQDDLEEIVALQKLCLAGDDGMTEWLRGYSTNLIARGELYVLEEERTWLGLGECRRSDTQAGVVDLGMMVDPNCRGRGLATEILERLTELALSGDLLPICSTTVDNVAARKAITRAGFVSLHRIVNITF